MPKDKVDINKIKERDVSEEEIKENEKESKKKIWIFYRIPIIVDVILAIIYIPTSNNILLIPISIIFALILYGADCKQRVCSYCKKWNSTVVKNYENVMRTSKVEKQNLVGKSKIKEKKNIVNKTESKCLNCGHESKKEVVK